MSKITVENVSFVYSAKTPFEVTALDNVSVNIEENCITGIIGHTGSGKSTLVQMFNGLLKPTSGRILLDGKDIWGKGSKMSDIRREVGLVMQYPEYQLFEDTVEADIAYGPKNMGLDEEEIKKRVLETADLVTNEDQKYEDAGEKTDIVIDEDRKEKGNSIEEEFSVT